MFVFFFFFKQKTAYELRISDWSSDVCSSDLFIDSRNGALGILHLGIDHGGEKFQANFVAIATCHNILTAADEQVNVSHCHFHPPVQPTGGVQQAPRPFPHAIAHPDRTSIGLHSSHYRAFPIRSSAENK